MTSMSRVPSPLSQSYLDALLTGDRANTRRVVECALNNGLTANELLNQLVWPTMELVQTLYRDDRITITNLNLATRLNRSITDQLTGHLERNGKNGALGQGHSFAVARNRSDLQVIKEGCIEIHGLLGVAVEPKTGGDAGGHGIFPGLATVRRNQLPPADIPSPRKSGARISKEATSPAVLDLFGG